MTGPTPATDEASFDRFCVGCGYNLRALTSDRCPECGLRLDEAAYAPVPWEGRRHIGTYRAFWRTVFLATLHPKRLAGAIALPLNDRDGRRFARIVAVVAAIPPIVFLTTFVGSTGFATLVVNFSAPYNSLASLQKTLGPLWEIGVIWFAGAMCFMALPIGLVATILMGSGASRFWARIADSPSVRRDRAFAISSYYISPLAWMFVPTLLFTVPHIAGDMSNHTVWMIAFLNVLLGCIALGAIVVIYVWNSLILIMVTTHCGFGRLIASAIGFIMFWLVSAIVWLGLFPMMVGLIWLMIDSLRG
ncbi:MAG TPA: hypothetical protein VHX86_17900 [Tepidisphaeraceae bacterium]|jgi:hypothetical protein|nr:hypothetical protein [Tepidisphaeraceae bacterium]